MSKNIDRKSLSKFPKNFIKQSDLLRYDFQKIIRSQQKIYSQRKVRSSQKNQQVRNNQTIEEGLTTKYKKSSVNKNRIKTEMDQEPIKNNSHRISFYEKNPYQKLIGFKRKKINGNQDLLNKFEAESKFKQYQTLINDQHKNKDHNKRKAFFLGQINLKNLTRSSKQKYDFPLTGKNFNNNKKNQRLETSEKKKINIQKYTSESLEKLKMADQKIKVCDDPKKKNEKTLEKYRKIYNNLIAEETISDIKEKSNQKFDEQAQDQLRTKSHLYQQKRKRKTQHDDQQNYQIVFQKSKKNQKKNNTNPFDLSREQMETFGDRFPQSFQKIKLLGRGGFSLVWLGQHKKSKKQFAIKQIKTQNNHQTHIKEIWFGTYFFQMGGNPKKQFAKHIGIKNLVKIYSYDINKNDTWIFYQKCGESLGNALYELKGETKNNQRVYRAIYKPFYFHLKNNQNQIRRIIIEVTQALVLLNQHKIVHSDLKTENILVKLKQKSYSDKIVQIQQQKMDRQSLLEEVKLIDYGSSFTFGNLKQFTMATPQYMAPQILNYILYENQMEYAPKLLDFLKNYNNPWVIDIWSLGCVLLEIVSGIPLWMSLKTIVKLKNIELITYGLFAIKGRLFDKIIKKQISTIQNLQHYLTDENYSGIVLEDDLKLVLKRMLMIDPSQRISPNEIIKILSQNLN